MYLKFVTVWVLTLLNPDSVLMETIRHDDRSPIPVVYSPYVSQVMKSKQRYPTKDSYTEADIAHQLEILSEEFKLVVTLGMGVTYGNGKNAWNNSESQSLIATTAAKLNSNVEESNQVKVIQGILVDQFWKTELQNALQSYELANKIFPTTVVGFCFNIEDIQSEYVTLIADFLSVENIFVIKHMTLAIRLVDSDCNDLLKSVNIKSLLEIVDTIICQYLPSPNVTSKIQPEEFAEEVLQRQEKLQSQFSTKKLNVLIETGWPSLAVKHSEPRKMSAGALTHLTHFVRFWDYLTNRKINPTKSIVMKEVFNQPLQCPVANEPGPACSYGYWFVDSDSHKSETFVRKKDLLLSAQTFNNDKNYQTDKITIICLVIVIIALLLLFPLGRYYYLRRKTKRDVISPDDYLNFLSGSSYGDAAAELQDDPSNCFPYNKDLEIPKEQLFLNTSRILGIGAFGIVFEGTIEGIEAPVAFKTIKVGNRLTIMAILAEIKIMNYIGSHPHIVGLLGAYTVEATRGTAYVAMEFCSEGSLQNYLRSSTSRCSKLQNALGNQHPNNQERYTDDPTASTPSVNEREKRNGTGKNPAISDGLMFKWAFEISEAMKYLQEKRVVHKDLATRNVLLTSSLTAKLSDFGLSRRLYTSPEYTKKSNNPMPWRWMAIETLKQMTFTSMSDVWSYGVTLWEIFTFGSVPYAGLGWKSDFANMLAEGLRPCMPQNCSAEVYDWMSKCWSLEPTSRPEFKEISIWLSKMIKIKMSIENETQ